MKRKVFMVSLVLFLVCCFSGLGFSQESEKPKDVYGTYVGGEIIGGCTRSACWVVVLTHSLNTTDGVIVWNMLFVDFEESLKANGLEDNPFLGDFLEEKERIESGKSQRLFQFNIKKAMTIKEALDSGNVNCESGRKLRVLEDMMTLELEEMYGVGYYAKGDYKSIKIDKIAE